MSESTDRNDRPEADHDAWAKASAEDIAAEKARRRSSSPDRSRAAPRRNCDGSPRP